MNIKKMLAVAVAIVLGCHIAWAGGAHLINTVDQNLHPDEYIEETTEEDDDDKIEVTSSDEESGTDDDIPDEPDYRRNIDILANSCSRGDEFVYTGGDTANDGSYWSYQIKTYPKGSYDKPVYFSTTEPIADSVGHKRTLNYDLAVLQMSEKDKADEAWLVFKVGDTSDPEYMEELYRTDHMNCYSKPTQGSIEIPEDAEYVYVEARLNNPQGYLPLLSNEISVKVE